METRYHTGYLLLYEISHISEMYIKTLLMSNNKKKPFVFYRLFLRTRLRDPTAYTHMD